MRISVAAAVAIMLIAGVGSAAHARARAAISDFQLDGGPPPALALQLQDGFVLGLVRAGVQVIDPTDTAHKLEGHPELQHCDSSPCLKAIGQLLDVGYVLRVKVDVAGNSYKGVARLFSTEGAAPAALPIATESKSCEVCTVAEARSTMLKLADAVRSHVDEPAPPPPTAPLPAPPPAPPHLAGPVIAGMAGALAVAAGAVVLAANGPCMGANCSEGRLRNSMGGVLIGAGAVLTVTGAYVAVSRTRGTDPITGATIGWRW